MTKLPTITNCDDCGACCAVTWQSPFREGEIEALPPRLRDEAKQLFRGTFSSCPWFDTETRQCKHYENRPKQCQDFQIGTDLCRVARRAKGVDDPNT